MFRFTLFFLATLLADQAFAEGFGSSDFVGTGNTLLRAAAIKDPSAKNYVAVGWSWTGSQYQALIASYNVADGGQDMSFALDAGLNGKRLVNLNGGALSNLCTAVTWAKDGFIAACRGMEQNVSYYYETYLVKFDNLGNLDTSFGTNGIKDTNLGGAGTHAIPRGIVYNPADDVVAVVGLRATTPFIAKFNRTTGAQVGSTGSVSAVSGVTAVAVTWDPELGFYYMASTNTGSSVNHVVYLSRHLASDLSESGSFGEGYEVSLTGAGGGLDTVPSAITIYDSKIIVVGGNRVNYSTSPWRCTVIAYTKEGALDTTFGDVELTGGTDLQGISLFNHYSNTGTSDDCILNSVAASPSGRQLVLGGTGYYSLSSNYDYVTVLMDRTGTKASGFGGSGVKLQGQGSADDVINNVLFLGADVTNIIGVGRLHNASLYNGAAAARFTTGVTSTGSWTSTTTTGAPAARAMGHPGVWTGSKMIAWGGDISGTRVNTGGVYDPVANSWTATATTGAPVGRSYATAAWTGSKMVIWGGSDAVGTQTNTGGIYTPGSNSWTATATIGAPVPSTNTQSVWTGSKIVVWGGYSGANETNTGGVYTVGGSWTSMTTVGAPSPRYDFSMVWTGSKVLVWGGYDYDLNTYFNTGALYDVTGNSWTSMTTTGAPSPRSSAATTWSGSSFFVWGGLNGSPLNTGGYYSPASDSWTTMTTTGAPIAAWGAYGHWTGARFLVWGGGSTSNAGGTYEPSANSWTTLTVAGAPASRYSGASVWTGSKLVIWGGTSSSSGLTNTGGVYQLETTPSSGGTFSTVTSNSWTATTTNGAPTYRTAHAAVWTGTKMVVWGGIGAAALGTGGVYDPIADSWTATTTSNAPAARYFINGAWTGTKMVIWGGYDLGWYYNTGALYDPATDSWTSMTTNGAPGQRYNHSVTWTGTKVVVWGGSDSNFVRLNTGGIYDPSGDSWSATATGAPPPREGHQAVWTGNTYLVIWGGIGAAGSNINSGGRFNVGSNTWAVLTTVGAPEARSNFKMVWTGKEAFVWGGEAPMYSSPASNAGGLYNPSTNSWTLTTTGGAPSGRRYFSMVWTGTEAIVWGGQGASDNNDGGRYNPSTNSWSATTTTGAPSGRSSHSAVWSGSKMIIWGGNANTGGIYQP